VVTRMGVWKELLNLLLVTRNFAKSSREQNLNFMATIIACTYLQEEA